MSVTASRLGARGAGQIEAYAVRKHGEWLVITVVVKYF
jgi:hypothetical protein